MVDVQVAVPLLVAKTMTYPEKVTQHNIERMRQLVLTGAEVWPGAFYVIAEVRLYLLSHCLTGVLCHLVVS
jgi:DNA-directed RNA polymerase beta' subunit